MAAHVAAILCSGSAGDRALAVSLAERGWDIAIGTLEKDAGQEFATASIANEVWAIGREQFSTVLEAHDATALAAFAAETADRLHRCDLLLVRATGSLAAPLDEVSAAEWELAVRAGLTVPMLAAHAFAPVIERDGGGSLVFVGPEEVAADDIAASVMAAARDELARRLTGGMEGRGVKVLSLTADAALDQLAALLENQPAPPG